MGKQQEQFGIDTGIAGHATVVAVRGEVDLVTAPKLEQALGTAAAERPRGLIVDLTATSFFDSAGVHALLRSGSQAEADGVRLSVVCGRSFVRTVLEIAGVDRIYQLWDTLDDAWRSIDEATQTASAPAPRENRLLTSFRRRAAGEPAPS